MKIDPFSLLFSVVIALLILCTLIWLQLQRDVEINIKQTLIDLHAKDQRESNQNLAQGIAQILKDSRSQLMALSFSGKIQNMTFDTKGTALVNSVFHEIKDIADNIIILSSNNTVVYDIHNKSSNSLSLVGKDFSDKSFVQRTKTEDKPIFSRLFVDDITDSKYNIAITYPVKDVISDRYLGMLISYIDPTELFGMFGNIYDPNQTFITAYDTDGKFLVNPVQNQSFVGKSALGQEYTKLLLNITNGKQIIDLYKMVLTNNVSSESPLEINSVRFNTAHPIKVDNQTYYFINIVTPIKDIYSNIDKHFSKLNMDITLMIILLGSTTILVLVLGRMWNQQLTRLVDKKTSQLAANIKAQKEFINIAAHELRTPTQTIIGYVDMMKKFPQKFETYLGALERNTNRLYRLTENILDMTRIENDSMVYNKEKFDLCEMVKLTTCEFEQEVIHYQRDNTYLVECAPSSIYINADKDKLQQVLVNFLHNAHKFTEKGIIKVKIEKINSRVMVTVTDNGKGIHTEIINKVFDKFVTKSVKGTGIGLYLTKKIVEAHGGHVWGFNRKEGGAEFGFSLDVR